MPPITTVRARVDRRRGRRRHRPHRPARDRHRRLRRASASRPPARWPARAPRSRSPCATPRAGDRTAADITATTGNADVHVAPPRPRRPGVVAAFVAGWSGPLHMLVNNAGVMALPELSSRPRAGSCSSPPTTSATSRSHSACTMRSPPPATRGSSSLSSRGAPALAGRLRRHALRAPPLRPVARLRAVEDRERAVRGRGDAPLGRRRHHRQRAAPGRDPAPTCSATSDAETARGARARAARGVCAARRSSRAPRPRCCVATSPALEGVGGRYFEDCNEARIVAANTTGRGAACARTRSIPTAARGCGRSR